MAKMLFNYWRYRPHVLMVGICKKLSFPVLKSKANYSSSKEGTFKTQPFKLYKLEKSPSTTVTINSELALKLYYQLYMLRRFETAAAELYKGKYIKGFCHLYLGQEAVAVGMYDALQKADSVITSYRCHAWTYLMGISIAGVLCELSGRTTGCSKGKGGSMHMYAPNFYGGNGIVGGQTPLGTGVGLSHKYKQDGGVSYILYGDGAANQGQLFESLNIAKLWNLPCVYVCENNIYGMGTKNVRSSANTAYYTRGDYVPGVWVDGMDVLATREATKYTREWCAAGKGPIIMEMETYRYMGHSMSDPGTSYRTREEVAEVRKTRDPINRFKERIIKQGLATEEQLKEIDKNVKKEVEEAVASAMKDPEADPADLPRHVLVLPLSSEVRGCSPSNMMKI